MKLDDNKHDRNKNNADTNIGYKSMLAMAAGACVLVACGGGGDTAASGTQAPTGFSNAPANYTAACNGKTLGSGATAQHDFSLGSIVVSEPVGTDSASVAVSLKTYLSLGADTAADTCAASALSKDITVLGKIKDLGTYKNYINDKGVAVPARIVRFTYTGLVFRLGTFKGSLPLTGATKDVAYVLDGNNLYVSKGKAGADGIGDTLSKVYGTKQAALQQ